MGVKEMIAAAKAREEAAKAEKAAANTPGGKGKGAGTPKGASVAERMAKLAAKAPAAPSEKVAALRAEERPRPGLVKQGSTKAAAAELEKHSHNAPMPGGSIKDRMAAMQRRASESRDAAPPPAPPAASPVSVRERRAAAERRASEPRAPAPASPPKAPSPGGGSIKDRMAALERRASGVKDDDAAAAAAAPPPLPARADKAVKIAAPDAPAKRASVAERMAAMQKRCASEPALEGSPSPERAPRQSGGIKARLAAMGGAVPMMGLPGMGPPPAGFARARSLPNPEPADKSAPPASPSRLPAALARSFDARLDGTVAGPRAR